MNQKLPSILLAKVHLALAILTVIFFAITASHLSAYYYWGFSSVALIFAFLSLILSVKYFKEKGVGKIMVYAWLIKLSFMIMGAVLEINHLNNPTHRSCPPEIICPLYQPITVPGFLIVIFGATIGYIIGFIVSSIYLLIARFLIKRNR